MEYYWIIGLIIRTAVCWVVTDDANTRGMKPVVWGIFAFIFPFVTGLIYLVSRKPKTEK